MDNLIGFNAGLHYSCAVWASSRQISLQTLKTDVQVRKDGDFKLQIPVCVISAVDW